MTKALPRRDFLRQVGLAGSLLLGLGSDAGWAAELLARGPAPAPDGAAPGLGTGQMALLGALAEGIVPRTDTPGAIGAGVPAFIALLYHEWMLPDERVAFAAGLAGLDQDCRSANGQPFVDTDPARQLALLRQWDAAVTVARRDDKPLPFFARLRTLVLVGYYTSEVGQVQELDVHYGGGADHAGGPMFAVPARV